ncbi:MAG: Holliday junction branch migration protein RuvA [Candidatus Marinimicrobia bacterium]|jgi:Holliday junction DNA helicase RuvA|nr:Holliday junction branch migration protein RuvA [Candidatus Neomarinimicrobiota bacterium]
MIDSLSGILVKKDPSAVIIDIGGVRLKVFITVGSYERLPSKGEQVELLTYLHVREDILNLYGFSGEEQRELFGLLNSVNGIGPRSALGILSGARTEDLKKRIISGDVKSLTVLPGIGPKIAKRIIVELKEKFVSTETDELPGSAGISPETAQFKDALQALQSLGFHRTQAYRALKSLEKSGELNGKLEDIIKNALGQMR